MILISGGHMRIRDFLATSPIQTVLVFVALLIAGISTVCVWLGLHAWALWAGVSLPLRPASLILGLRSGTVVVPVSAWYWVVGAFVVGIATIFGVVTFWISLRAKSRVRGDEAARLSGGKSEVFSLTARAAEEKARRLGVKKGCGLPVARSVRGGVELFSSYEDVTVLIAGPRTGKTTSWAVPRILAAPGAVIATSNKRDILDTTGPVRARRGGGVWVFDPQKIAGTEQQWWWNPLSYITSVADAADMAKVFYDCSREAGSSKDGFFDTEGRNLIANLLLAASVKKGANITQVLSWLNHPDDDEPAVLLRAAGYVMAAESVDAQYNLVAETRSGVFGTAHQLVAFLANDALTKWITPVPGMPEFDPAQFVRSHDSLYLLSQEGKGNATAVVTALTVAVNEAAKGYSQDCGGRVPTPIYICLDEAANVCKWGELPDMYSHFGSRGVLVDTLLQSWSQAKDVWGEAGVRKLWSAANVKVYAGGVSEVEFLQQVSELIGDHWIDSRQISSSSHGQSVSYGTDQLQRRIATVADLAALPSGRAWVIASTSRPVLCRFVPWFKTALADEIKEGSGDDGR